MTTITVTLTEEEQNALQQIIHVALQHSGIRALDVATHFKNKMASAKQEAEMDRQREEEASKDA